MIKKRSVLYYLVIALSVMALSLASCSKPKKEVSEQKEAPKKTNVDIGTETQVFHYGNGTEPKDLDPHIATGVPEHHIITALLEGLVSPNPKDLSPEPGAAESWEVNSKSTEYVFKIGADRKWSNGDPVTAHDFVYSWKRILTPTLGSEYAYMLHVLKNAEAFNTGKLKDFNKVGVKAVDDKTLKVTLKAPTPYFLQLLSHYSTYPVHQATIEKFGTFDQRGTKWTQPGNFVGNGAFVLTDWQLNKIITIERNRTYWDDKTTTLAKVHFYPIDKESTEEMMFRTGALHSTSTVPIEKIDVYRSKEPEKLKISTYLGTYYYRINCTKKALKNKYVRKALAYSIDRETIVNNVTKGGEIAAFAYTPTNTAGYTSRTQIEYNVEMAKEFLKKAGYPDGKGFPKIEILYNTSESHKKIALVVQSMWKENLGIDVELVNQDWKVYLSSQKMLRYDISRAGWIGDYADPNTFLDMFVKNGGNNQTGWANKTHDAYISKAALTQGEERMELFQKAETILLDELPIIPIYYYTKKSLLHPDVKGWDENVLDTHPLKYVRLTRD